MRVKAKVWLRTEQVEDGKIKLSKVVEYGSGAQVTIPVALDGSVKWFDDSKLIKTECRK